MNRAASRRSPQNKKDEVCERDRVDSLNMYIYIYIYIYIYVFI